MEMLVDEAKAEKGFCIQIWNNLLSDLWWHPNPSQNQSHIFDYIKGILKFIWIPLKFTLYAININTHFP